MAVSDLVLRRLDRVKTVAVVVETHHKTERTDGALIPYTLRVTDARYLRDGDNLFLSRLLPGYQLEESTGARQPPDLGQDRLPRGTSIKGGAEPNRFRWEVSNRKDSTGNTLDAWQSLALCGSTVAVYRGAEMDEIGGAYSFSDYVEVFYGKIVACERGQESWTLEAVSPEGWHQDRGLSRRMYAGEGFGVYTLQAGGVDGYLAGSGAVFVPTGGAYTFSCRVGFVTLPSSRVGNGGDTLFRYEKAGGQVVLNISVTEAGDQVKLEHWNGFSDTLTFTGWTLTADDVGLVQDSQKSKSYLPIGIRWDGTTAYLYVRGELVDSGTLSISPEATGTDVIIGRSGPGTQLGDFAIYEAWLSGEDVGHVTMRERQGGPLVYARAEQEDLWLVYKFLEGSVSGATVVHNLVYGSSAADVNLNGNAFFFDSLEGDDPDIGGPRGNTKPLIIGGPIFNLAVMPRNQVGLGGAGPVYDISANTCALWRGRVDGARLQVYYTLTASPASSYLLKDLGPDNRSAVRSEAVARRIIPRFIDTDGTVIRGGSEIEISASAGQDGIVYATEIRGEIYTFIESVWPGTPGGGLFTLTIPAIGSTADLATENGSLAGRSIIASRRFQGTLTADVDSAASTPNATEAYTLLKNLRDRDEDVEIGDVSLTDGHAITWVGPDGERFSRWAFAIAGAADVAYREGLAKLLESYFMWSTDTARVGNDLGVRMGLYAAPDGTGNVYSADQVVEESIQALATLPPAWRVVVRYRPNYSPFGERQIFGVMEDGERLALARDASEVEVFRDRSILRDFENAREVYWDTTLYDAKVAIRVGVQVADFLKVPRTWWSFRANIRPEAEEIGSQVTFEHQRFGGALPMVVHGKTHAIAPLGVDLITVS